MMSKPGRVWNEEIHLSRICVILISLILKNQILNKLPYKVVLKNLNCNLNEMIIFSTDTLSQYTLNILL